MNQNSEITADELASLLEDPDVKRESVKSAFRDYNTAKFSKDSSFAVMPAAGNGSRMQPVTDGDAKELLEVGNQSMILNAAEPLTQYEGLENICVVIRPGKSEIIEHMEEQSPDDVKVGYSPVFESEGLAESLHASEPFVEDTFGVILPDTYFEERGFFEELMTYHEEEQPDATLGCVRVENPENHGVLDVEDAEQSKGEVNRVVEKPDSDPASDIVIAGTYIFEPEIYDKIEQNIRKDRRRKGEYRLATSINDLEEINYRIIECGAWTDVGAPERLSEARQYEN